MARPLITRAGRDDHTAEPLGSEGSASPWGVAEPDLNACEMTAASQPVCTRTWIDGSLSGCCSGLSGFLSTMFSGLGSVPIWLAVALVISFIVFFTEITSNTATVTTAIPILVLVAGSIGQDAPQLVLPAALAGSFAFMLPTATAPNAIVYGTGQIRLGNMIRAGFWLNCLSVFVLSLLAFPLVQSLQLG